MRGSIAEGEILGGGDPISMGGRCQAAQLRDGTGG